MSSFKKFIINNQQVSIISCDNDLYEFCMLIQDQEIIAIDTEFSRVNLYYPKLCLLQISDGINIGVIDMQTITEFACLESILFNPKKIKIIHSARQDVEAIFHHFLKKIENIYDSQLAAEFCQFGTKPSYFKLTNDIVNMQINKNCSYSNWEIRPLTEQQIYYAATDVAYLHDIYYFLESELEKLERKIWFNEELKLYYDNPNFLHIDDNYYWFKLIAKLKNKNHQLIYSLCCWRERTAKINNIPRNQIFTDNSLISLSYNNSAENIIKHIDINYKNYNQLLAIIDEDFIDKLPDKKNYNINNFEQERLIEIQSKIEKIADQLQIPPQLIATTKLIKKIVSCHDLEAISLANWKKSIFIKNNLFY